MDWMIHTKFQVGERVELETMGQTMFVVINKIKALTDGEETVIYYTVKNEQTQLEYMDVKEEHLHSWQKGQ